jgi:CDP-diacylglycerol--serine O-phosphatidyltransferase
MIIKKHIPNAITCCNLICGCLAIVQIFEGNLVFAAYLVGLAAIFDFLDGFVARLLHVTSPIGKDLDSLADMVTFGVVPGFVMFQLIRISVLTQNPNSTDTTPAIAFFAFIIPVLSAVRLAKFNHDTRQTDSFIGVPTPANAILICSIPLLLEGNHFQLILNPFTLCLLALVLSLLLVSEIHLFALKFKNFNWRGNEIRFIFLGLSAILLSVLQLIAIPLIIILYILISIVSGFIKPATSE